MKSFMLLFENGMPKGTAQQKGERISYAKNGRPYIQHFKKKTVAQSRAELVRRLQDHAPEAPTRKPVRLEVLLTFDIKDRKKWGNYKTTKPDCSNYIKELEDAMTECGFWEDDSQVAELSITKVYAEKASIQITIDELEEKP